MLRPETVQEQCGKAVVADLQWPVKRTGKELFHILLRHVANKQMSLIDNICNEAQLNIIKVRQRSRHEISHRTIVIRFFGNCFCRVELMLQLLEFMSCQAFLTEILQYKILPVGQQVKHTVDVHGMLFP